MVEREVSEGLLLELWCLPDRNPPSLNSLRRIIVANADGKVKHDDERANENLVSKDFLEKLADRGRDRLRDSHRDALTFTKFPGHHERQWAP